MLSKRAVAKSAMWSAVGGWSGQGIRFLVFAVLAVFLGPEAYGLVAMAMVVIGASEIFITCGLTEALVQRKEIERAHIDTVFWAQIGLASCLAVTFFAAADPIAVLFGEPLVAELIRWLSVTPLLQALGAVPLSLLRREMRFDLLALRSAVGLISGGTVGIIMALLGFGAWSLVGHQLTQCAANSVVLWVCTDWRPRPTFSARHLRDVRGLGVQFMGTRLLTLGEHQLVRALIGVFLGPVALGFYYMGWRLIEILYVSVLLPIANIAMPAFSRLQSDLAQVRHTLHIGSRMIASVGFPSFLGLAVIAPDLIPLCFGEKWAGSAPVTQILALQGLQWSVSLFYGGVMQGLGRPALQFALHALGIATLALLLPAFAGHGIEAVAWCVVIQSLLLLPIATCFVRRLTGLDVKRHYLAHLPALGSALVMAAAVAGWRSIMLGTLGDAAIVATSIALGVAVYTLGLLASDRELVRRSVGLTMLAVRRSSSAGAD